VSDEGYRRYVRINLPHARTIVSRVGRSLEALGAFGEAGNGGALALHRAFDAVEKELEPFDDDPVQAEALRAADAVAERARELAAAILETPARSDRASTSQPLRMPGRRRRARNWPCAGERPDSPLR
jgi:hypothetical protein